MNKKILILSPHLDDAVFSCCQHILDWKKKNYDVCILTFFTQFPNLKHCPPYLNKYLLNCGVSLPEEFQNKRIHEDIRAMDLLRVEYKHLNFVDGAFRTDHHGLNLYKTYKELTNNPISDVELEISNNISSILESYQSYDEVYTPMTIGGHIDHRIVNLAAKQSYPVSILRTYLEFPYMLYPGYWRIKFWFKHIKFRFSSIKMSTKDKKAIISCYETQRMFNFFKVQKFVPEIIY